MKKSKAIMYFIMICLVLSAAPTLAANDYLGDPTVPGTDWMIGMGLEGWWAFTEMDTPDAVTSKGKDNTYYPIWGVNLVAGKGNLTLFANYRNGSADFAFTNDIGGTQTQYRQDLDFWELEIKGRYLFPKAGNPDRWVPFISGGLLYVYQDQQYRINTPGQTFLATGTAHENHEVSFLSPMAGGGVILPLGPRWGLRAEASLLYTFGDRERRNVITGWKKKSGDGLGFETSLVMYWLITPHVGLDLGLDYRYLEGGSEVGQYGRAGVFSLLRYRF